MSDFDIGTAALGWWKGTLSDSGPGRMARAKLRRCDSPAEALQVEATHRLHRALGDRLTQRADYLALIAVALANVKDSTPETAPARMGQALSALRFQSLIRSEAPADLIRPLRRALAQIDHTANVAGLACDLFYWSDKTRNRWAFAYYGATIPQIIESPQESDA